MVNNIIEQIASGENTINTISLKVGEKDTTVLYSLEKLMEVGLVEKRKCITEEKNRKKNTAHFKGQYVKILVFPCIGPYGEFDVPYLTS